VSDLSSHFKKVLGYGFRNEALLITALTHRSFSKTNNERLEYLGDAIVGFFIAEQLYIQFPQAAEGELTRLRSALVKKESLARIARDIQLGEYIKLGVGERKSGGWQRDSILSNAMEALIGAIYLDSDLENCRLIILGLYSPLLASLTLANIAKDPKTKLQEYLQANKCALPSYNVISEEGEDHDKLFIIKCEVEGFKDPVIAEGKSKRSAEQLAAAKALKILKLDIRHE